MILNLTKIIKCSRIVQEVNDNDTDNKHPQIDMSLCYAVSRMRTGVKSATERY